jgi:hypothetical protein
MLLCTIRSHSNQYACKLCVYNAKQIKQKILCRICRDDNAPAERNDGFLDKRVELYNELQKRQKLLAHSVERKVQISVPSQKSHHAEYKQPVSNVPEKKYRGAAKTHRKRASSPLMESRVKSQHTIAPDSTGRLMIQDTRMEAPRSDMVFSAGSRQMSLDMQMQLQPQSRPWDSMSSLPRPPKNKYENSHGKSPKNHSLVPDSGPSRMNSKPVTSASYRAGGSGQSSRARTGDRDYVSFRNTSQDVECIGTSRVDNEEMVPLIPTSRPPAQKFKTMQTYKERLCEGVMRKYNFTTLEDNNPWPHQKAVVNKFLEYGGLPFLVVNHEMGTGKTATTAQIYAGLCTLRMEACNNDAVSMMISVPTTTMEQWRSTMKNWLDLRDYSGITNNMHDDNILVTNNAKDLQQLSKDKRIIITTPGCLNQLHRVCYVYKHDLIQDSKGRMKGGFTRTGVVVPLFDRQFDILVIDEVQRCKNSLTATAHLHHVIACNSKHRVLLSGTIVCNKPEDLSGIAYAGNCPKSHPASKTSYDFQKISTFVYKEQSNITVNRNAIEEFQRLWVDRVAAAECGVPIAPISFTAVNYQVNFDEVDADNYNELIHDLRQSMSSQRSNNSKNLLGILTKMCFHVVHPIITLCAQAGYKFKNNAALYDIVVQNPSSCMRALLVQLRELKNRLNPHKRIVVASSFVIPLQLVKKWIDQKYSDEFGETFMFTGEISASQREKNKTNFLEAENSIMFLNILAGGVGLHLVPGCECMIFWGGLPYSPANIDQCVARIQRFGQTAPLTHLIEIIYLIPYGSRDFAIGRLHTDKRRVMDFTHDKDVSGFDNIFDNVWRKSSKILSDCLPIGSTNEENDLKNFPPMPLQLVSHASLQAHDFQLITGVTSREQNKLRDFSPNTNALTNLRDIFQKDILALRSNNIPPRLLPMLGDYALELITSDVDINSEHDSEDPDAQDES